jgi:hypothetical protein
MTGASPYFSSGQELSDTKISPHSSHSGALTAPARRPGATLRLHGDAKRRLLHRLRSQRSRASAGASGYRDGGRAAESVSWGPVAPAYAHQVGLQADQTHRTDRVHKRQAGRLLDEAWLRLVRGALDGPRTRDRLSSHETP